MSFAQKGNLNTHKKTHTGVKPYSCDVCGMRFALKSYVNGHKRTHIGEKTCTCDECGGCGATFAQKSYLKSHKRMHSGEKPYSCDECPSKFISKSGLTQHKGYSHRGIGVLSPRDRRKLMKMNSEINSAR